jgi:L-ascorbate metabolism protein UlaG (beta-lactamase superfamily)
LTDPYLTPQAGPFGFGPERYVDAGIPLDRLPPIDIILVSHNHYDHLDAKTIDALPDKLRAQVIVPLGLGDFFRTRGYARVHELDWYERMSSDGVEIEVLPAIHFSRRGPFDKNRSLWSGFAIRGAAYSIFHSGDTGYHDTVFHEIGRRAGPFDLALVAIGAYEPRSIMRAVHVNPEEAVQLIADIGAKTALGMHWGTVQLTDEPVFEPPRRFIEAARAAGWPDGRAGTMRIGETRPLPLN